MAGHSGSGHTHVTHSRGWSHHSYTVLRVSHPLEVTLPLRESHCWDQPLLRWLHFFLLSHTNRIVVTSQSPQSPTGHTHTSFPIPQIVQTRLDNGSLRPQGNKLFAMCPVHHYLKDQKNFYFKMFLIHDNCSYSLFLYLSLHFISENFNSIENKNWAESWSANLFLYSAKNWGGKTQMWGNIFM